MHRRELYSHRIKMYETYNDQCDVCIMGTVDFNFKY